MGGRSVASDSERPAAGSGDGPPFSSGEIAPPSPAPDAFVPCRNHADRATEAVCGRCADLICSLCSVWSDGQPYCPSCIVRVRSLDIARPEGYIPWEDRARLGTLTAAWRTMTLAFTDGQRLYEQMPVEGGLGDPLLYGMLMRGIVIVVYGVLATVLYLIIGLATNDPVMFMQAGFQAGGIVFQIMQAAVMLFFLGGLIHLAVLVFGGERGFEATFRVYAYGRGVDVLELIPVAGQLAAALWRLWLYWIGLQQVHKLPSTKAGIAASLPFLLFLFFFLVVMGMVIVMIVLLAAAV
jgi:hypothetical protein